MPIQNPNSKRSSPRNKSINLWKLCEAIIPGGIFRKNWKSSGTSGLIILRTGINGKNRYISVTSEHVLNAVLITVNCMSII